MANTTFNGPVRSENGFQSISIDATTGTETVNATYGTNIATTGRLSIDTGTAVVAGGRSEILMTSTANLGIYVGSGAPTVSAAKGSLYLRTDGSSTSTRAYINTDGATTWTAITTAA